MILTEVMANYSYRINDVMHLPVLCLEHFSAWRAVRAAVKQNVKFSSGCPDSDCFEGFAVVLTLHALNLLQTSKLKYDKAKSKVDFLQGKVKVIEKELSKEVRHQR